MAEMYLVKVMKPNIAARSFDNLRYMIYVTRKKRFFSELPPTSSAIKRHLLQAYCYINICFGLVCFDLTLVGSSSMVCLFRANFFETCQKYL